MTRDEVLEEAAATLEDHAERMGGWEPFVDKGVAYRDAAGVARALKSKPPEKSPEVVTTLGEMLKERAELLARLDGVEAERDHYREALAAQEKRAEEALARVKHIEWEMNGAKMPGETP